MLGREHQTIQDMEWIVPAGERSQLDHIDKFFKHRLPGRKSEKFDISLINSSISGTDIQQIISSNIKQGLSAICPVNSGVRNIEWTGQ